MNWKKISFIALSLLLIATFFFKIIPVPVENVEGNENPDKYIFGGFYWTSILYQFQVANYVAVFYLGLAYLSLIGGTYLIVK